MERSFHSSDTVNYSASFNEFMRNIQPPMHDVFFQCFRLPKKGEEHQLYPASCIYSILLKRFPQVMRGMNAHPFGKTLITIGAERVHTVQGNVYRVMEVE